MTQPRQHVPVGSVTRGTTARGRLRRIDTWLAAHLGHRLRTAPDPLVVDLGFGASPVTTLELRDRLVAATGSTRIRVVGLEIDPVRVAAALPSADPPRLDFRRGGFELAGLRPLVLRAMNVLRQYDEHEVPRAWATMTAALAPGGVLVEGTCDESGRLASWVLLDRTGPRSLTLAAALTTLDAPSTLAERLPKALIHRNIAGEPIHDLIATLDRGWRMAARYAPYGPRQRWRQAVAATRAAGWPVIGSRARWCHGEVTVRWSAVAAGGASARDGAAMSRDRAGTCPPST